MYICISTLLKCAFIFVLNKHQLMVISFNPPCAVPNECAQQINVLCGCVNSEDFMWL